MWSGKAIKKEQAGPGRKAEIKRPKVRRGRSLLGESRTRTTQAGLSEGLGGPRWGRGVPERERRGCQKQTGQDTECQIRQRPAVPHIQAPLCHRNGVSAGNWLPNHKLHFPACFVSAVVKWLNYGQSAPFSQHFLKRKLLPLCFLPSFLPQAGRQPQGQDEL